MTPDTSSRRSLLKQLVSAKCDLVTYVESDLICMVMSVTVFYYSLTHLLSRHTHVQKGSRMCNVLAEMSRY